MAGRPPIYDTPEKLERAIEEYFEKCQPEPFTINGEPVRDAKGNVVMNHKVPTTAGLALHLGYESRQSLYDQKGRGEEFSYIIKRAIMAIEDRHESNLQGTTPTGSIFWLKNHKWVDKFENENTNKVELVTIGKPDFVKNDN